jgi:hypothetical protein
MAQEVTLDLVEALAGQLPVADRLKLAARICNEASAGGGSPAGIVQGSLPSLEERRARADALLAELDAAAEQLDGPVDAAKDIGEIRAERADRL